MQVSTFGPIGDLAGLSITHVTLGLLRDGLVALDDDLDAARAHFIRALSLLETERSSNRSDGSNHEVTKGGLRPWQARRVETHVDANLDAPLRVTDLARLTLLGADYFARAFKQSFGIPPHSYVLQCRLRHACEMMLATDESIAQISIACGFSDQAHFTRRFRDHIGVPPCAWRRAHRAAVPAELGQADVYPLA